MTQIMWVSYYMIKLLQQQLKIEKYYERLLESIRFPSSHSLPFRENWSYDSKSEEESNFHQLLMLRSLDDQGGSIPDRR